MGVSHTQKCSSRGNKFRGKHQDWAFGQMRCLLIRDCKFEFRPSVCGLIEPAWRYDRWDKTSILSVLGHIIEHPGASILILRPPAALACPHYYGISLPTTDRNTLNLGDCFCADCVHTALSCNVGSFSTECRDKSGLAGGIAVAAFIKKPLEHGFRYSAQLLAFAVTVCRLSKLDRKRHACVELKYLEYAI